MGASLVAVCFGTAGAFPAVKNMQGKALSRALSLTRARALARSARLRRRQRQGQGKGRGQNPARFCSSSIIFLSSLFLLSMVSRRLLFRSLTGILLSVVSMFFTLCLPGRRATPPGHQIWPEPHHNSSQNHPFELNPCASLPLDLSDRF